MQEGAANFPAPKLASFLSRRGWPFFCNRLQTFQLPLCLFRGDSGHAGELAFISRRHVLESKPRESDPFRTRSLSEKSLFDWQIAVGGVGALLLATRLASVKRLHLRNGSPIIAVRPYMYGSFSAHVFVPELASHVFSRPASGKRSDASHP